MKKILVFAAVFLFALNGSAIFAQQGTAQPTYHLLIVDRINAPLDSDIGEMANATMLYKFRHQRNGYIVALYSTTQQGTLVPQLPNGARVMANMSSPQKAGIRDYINSSSFRRFVTSSTVTSGLLVALDGANTEPRATAAAATQPFYHLLILDRMKAPLDSDIGNVANATMLYKYRHGRNGYLIALYTSTQQSPLLPQLPNGATVVVNISSIQRASIRDYINSSAFRRYVTNRTVTSALLGAF